MSADGLQAGAAPSRYRWTILAVGASGTAAFAMFFFGLPSLAPLIRDRYDLSLSEMGLAFTMVSIGGAAGLLPWGILADRIGERAVFCLGLTAGSVAIAGVSFSPSFITLLAGFGIASFMGASTSGAGARAVMGWFGAGERGLALGIRQMAAPAGGAVGALLLPLVASIGSLRSAFLMMAAFSLAAAAAAAIWMREAPAAPRGRQQLGSVIGNPRFWRLGISCLLLATGLSVSLGFIVLFLHDARGFSPGLAAAALALVQIVGATARIVSGRFSDRSGLRVPPLRRFALAIAITFGLTGLLTDAPGPVLYPLLFVTGVLAISWNALSVTAAAELGGAERAGSSAGFVVTCIAAGTVLAPYGFAALVEATSWGAGFGAVAVAPLLAMLLLKSVQEDEASRKAQVLDPSPLLAKEIAA